MTCTANDLKRTMDEFTGGSDNRYRHQFNGRFIYTEGVKQVAGLAGAYWLLDTLALKIAPLYAKAWLADEVGIGIVKLVVFTDEQQAADSTLPNARLTLLLHDDVPEAYSEDIVFTTFPDGEWTFYLGTDQVAENSYVTTVYLPQEH
jgi:hypothetical protein